MLAEILVIECKQGSCRAGDAFKNRATLAFSAGVSYLHLNPVMYNDGGKYICSCSGSLLCQQTLDVIGK